MLETQCTELPQEILVLETQYTELPQDILEELAPDLAERIHSLRESLYKTVERANQVLQSSTVAPLIAEALRSRHDLKGSARLFVRTDGKVYLETGPRQKTSVSVSEPQVDDLTELFPTD